MIERESTKKYALEIRVGGPASYLVVPLVMLLASAVAIGLCFFIAFILKVDTGRIDRWIMILSVPWFAALYFIVRKSRDLIEQGIIIKLGDNREVAWIEMVLAVCLSTALAAHWVASGELFELLKRFIR
jgi:hypothetical protein